MISEPEAGVLQGDGRVETHGLCIDGHFHLRRNASSTRFDANGTVGLLGRSLAQAEIIADSAGGFFGDGRVSFAGQRFDVCVCIDASGNISLDGSVSVSASVRWVGSIRGTARLRASSTNTCVVGGGTCSADPFTCGGRSCASAGQIGAGLEATADFSGFDPITVCGCLNSSGEVRICVSRLCGTFDFLD